VINGKGHKPRPMIITKVEWDIRFNKIFKKKKRKGKK